FSNLHFLERWYVLGHRIRERELTLFEQHHRSHGGYRLGHGIDAEDRVLGHWHLFLDIETAHGLEVNDLALPRDPHYGAGNVPLGNLDVECVRDALESFCGQTHALWRCGRKGIRECGQWKEESEEQCGQQEPGVHGVFPRSRHSCSILAVRGKYANSINGREPEVILNRG